MLTVARKTPLIDAGDSESKRAEIRQYFNDTFDLYESLFSTLASDKTFYLRPDALRHPLIFYFGHTAVFFVNKLLVSKLIDERVDPVMESMLAIGVDEMSWDDLNEANYDWPTVDAVRQYRNRVRALVNRKIDSMPLQLPIKWEDPFWIILMGIEHERIHLETSSVLIRQLPLVEVQPSSRWLVCPEQHSEAPVNALVSVAGGEVVQGRRKNDTNTYGWDNEFGCQLTTVSDFRSSRYLVSNQEFLEFVEEGGYETEQWWTEEGWQWVGFRKARHPLFWIGQESGGYKYRAMLEEIDMPWSWPVEVNYLEAKAFCNWLGVRSGKSIRLPTEAEWYRLYDLSVDHDHAEWTAAPGNVNLEYFASSMPVDYFMQGEFADVVGNVWQWTETPIDAFDGFEVHPAYDDFSVPTFDGKHNLIKGGSWISTGNESIRDSRYAFRRHFFQHAGFRYVESEVTVSHQFNTYETDTSISQYLEFHYGDEYFGVPNFPRACVEMLVEIAGVRNFGKALDIGCAVGRGSFELARYADHVDAVDFSTRFIRNALSLREHGQLRYLIPTEGELTLLKEVRLDALGLVEVADRVEFSQGDACNLRSVYAGYDVVYAGNLIDRLYEPARFLRDIPDRINQGGYLVLVSPYTWMEEFTEKANWIGGIKENGESLTTLEGVRRLLSGKFDLVGAPADIPFVIRETARKYQHTLAQMTVWKKR